MTKGRMFWGGLVIAAMVYLAASPYLTAYQMKEAADNNDGEALSEHIDFPSVRQSLKDQMNVMFAKQISEDKDLKDNPFAALGSAFAGVMVDKMVDTYVTQAGLIQMMEGEESAFMQGEDTVERDHDNVDPEPFENADMYYESLNKFVIEVNDDDDQARFIMRRRGLIDWKLTEIFVPVDKLMN